MLIKNFLQNNMKKLGLNDCQLDLVLHFKSVAKIAVKITPQYQS